MHKICFLKKGKRGSEKHAHTHTHTHTPTHTHTHLTYNQSKFPLSRCALDVQGQADVHGQQLGRQIAENVGHGNLRDAAHVSADAAHCFAVVMGGWVSD